MDRRRLLRIWLAGVVTVPAVRSFTPARVQAARQARVGVLFTTNPIAAAHIVAAFEDALREHGHVDGKTVALEYRWAENRPDRFDELAADLVRQKVDVLVASSQAPALAAQRATRTIPIVMVNATDPVGAGLVKSLARPGGNVTGLSEQLTPEIRAKQLQLLKEAVPRVSRVVVLRSPTTTVGLREYEIAGQQLGLRVVFSEVRTRDDIARAVTAIAADRAAALVVPGDTFLFTERQWLGDLVRQHRVPGMYALREYSEAGGLMSYSARLTDQFRSAAGYVDKILRGASPATLPVEPPSQYELVLNLRTARALGVTLPPALLLRAGEVIE
jgi:putative ABC transport system substrate-binding protein